MVALQDFYVKIGRSSVTIKAGKPVPKEVLKFSDIEDMKKKGIIGEEKKAEPEKKSEPEKKESK